MSAAEGKRYPTLNPGDAVKVRFGTRWYNAEVVKKWEAKSWKGNCFIASHCLNECKFLIILRPLNVFFYV
jgi:hypothetical protein